MFHLMLAVASPATSATEPPTAAQVVARFAQDFCVPGADRLARIKAWNMPAWRTTRSQVEADITFVVDAPSPKHDKYNYRHEGAVQGGTASISSFVFDFEDPGTQDYSHASLAIRPESLISKEAIERALSVQLIPNGRVIERPGVMTITGGGEPPVTTEPYTEWMQHYNAGSSFNGAVSITARRMWGTIGDQQSWYIACSTFTPPTNL